MAAVFLFSGASSGGGVVRQPCCLWSFAEREPTLLFFPPVLFLLLLSHILNLHSIPAKCQDQWGKCAKSVLGSPCVYNDSALAGVADNMHARSTPCLIRAENMFISWKNNGDSWVSVPPRVHGAFLTWIPAVRTVRHVCGDNAQPAAVSCLHRASKRIHDGHCWLLFRPSGKLGGVVPPAHSSALVMPAMIFFSWNWEWEYGYPFIQGRRFPPSPRLKKRQEVVFGLGI